MDQPLRVLIVDDTVTYRKIVSDVLTDCPDVEVIGTAANGRIALQRLDQQAADLLVLDLEMPEMNGQAVLEELRRRKSPTGAIMLSAFTSQGAKATVAALETGAFDFVLKPSGTNLTANVEHLRRELRTKLSAYARCRSVKQILYGGKGAEEKGRRGEREKVPSSPFLPFSPSPQLSPGPPQVVALGISTGGPQALSEMVPQLPADLPVPLLIVQHMPPVFTKSLADDLNNRTRLSVREGVDGQPIGGGEVWIAPGGRQMKVRRENDRVVLRITDDPPENSCRPSVDYLFRSVAEVYGGRAVGVIMTGMGNDGSLGCRRLKHCGAAIIAQDAATCVVFGMPREPIEKGIVDAVVPLGRIAAEIARWTAYPRGSGSGAVQVTPEDIRFVAELVSQLCGVVLDDSKGYLIESRLGQLARERGCASYRELCQRARTTGDRALQQKIIDAITTQETLFFRDASPFDALQNRVLPDLIDAAAGHPRGGYARPGGDAPRKLRFWSAACSTGQEPYSLAMVLRETIPNLACWNVSILATDISDAAIAQASRGRYAAHEIDRGMRPSFLPKYFTPHSGGWQVKDEVRGMVSFQRRNLLQPFTEVGTFDVIFCRNVAIYFDAPRRRDLFLRLADRLAPGGAMFVGSSESLLDLGPRFAPRNHCRATYYQPS